jgi:alpha-N-arabinofuranosidase
MRILPVSSLSLCLAATVVWARAPADDTTTTLHNPGFESGLDGWSVHVYGARPAIEFDSEVVHEGKQSLRISGTKPSDTGLGQEIMLKAGRWYRFTGWVRTRGLDPHGAPVYGTFQIQQPAGKGVIAGGANHGGDTDWTETAIYFKAPPGGRTRVAPFFVGFGKGTGTAWFDDFKIEEIDLSRAPVRITRQTLYPGGISPLQYGQFIEYLCDLVPSMWAERLYDGSFEGLSPYKFVFLKEKDFREKPWYPAGAVNRAEFSLDPKDPVSGAVAKMIRVKDGAPCTVGIAQDGIFIDRGKPCIFSCFMRHEGVRGPVHVRLHHEGKVHAACEFRPTDQWRKYSARLEATERDTAATLTIDFRGPGTLWLDNASLMPVDTIGGWRPDVVEALRALKCGIIRFGGSVLDDPNLGEFDWRDTVGDPDRRKPFRAWGGLQPTGPGMEEFLQLCRRVEAEPLICVRFSKRTPQDAAEQVEYFNGTTDTPQGKIRAKNDHPEPYRIKYWQVGNERSGKDYEARLADFCKAMKKVDPTIKLLSSYPTAGVLEKAGRWLDYVCPHHYECEDLAFEENSIRRVRALLTRASFARKEEKEHRGEPPRREGIKIAVTEWNTTAGDAGPGRAKLWSLDNALACARYHNLLHRHGDIVMIANRSNLTNSFCSGIIQTDNHRLYRTPTYYAQQLYATQAGNRALKIESKTPPDVLPDFSATLSAKGDAVVLFAVNRTLQDITRPLDFSAFGGKGREITIFTLTDRQRAGEPDVTNSFGDPERVGVVVRKVMVAATRLSWSFPALSLTVLRWPINRSFWSERD